jgi:putative transposase
MRIGQTEPRNIAQLCSLFGYSRQAYYQSIRSVEKEALQSEIVMQEVLHIREEQKLVGARKLLKMMNGFFDAHDIEMGRDTFFDLLRSNGLLIRERKRSKPITTWSRHWFKKHPNLIREFVPTAANQLWVSDITYVIAGSRFAYLSLVTDAYSRKIVGFYLSKDLSAKGCIKALGMALRNNPIRDNLIHHSDRGVQYCGNDYVQLLRANTISISMTQSGDPLENAIAERVNGILKRELLEKTYPLFDIAQKAIAEAISIYNYKRLHLSIDMLTPAQAHHLNGDIKRNWKNYYKKREEAQLVKS